MLTERVLPETDAYDRQVLKEIEEKTQVEGPCLIWIGFKQRQTPIRSYHGRRMSVRQIIYKLICDYDAEGRLASKCGRRDCVAPEHLEPWEGNRASIGDLNRKLTEQQRAEIIATPIGLKGSGKRLAKRLNVSESLISKLRKGQREPKEEAVGSL